MNPITGAPPVLDKYDVFVMVLTNTAATFLAMITGIEAPSDEAAYTVALKGVMENGVLVSVMAGLPPVKVKVVACIPFHAEKRSAVSRVTLN